MLELSEQFGSFAVTETHAPLQTGFRKIGEGIRRQAEIQSGFATAECVTLADALMYAANEAKEAKDALVQRQLILDEHRSAERSALSKQRALEKLRNSGSIKQDRVTETLEEYEAAAKHEKNLAQRLQAVSTELQPSVIEHAKTMHEDLFSALLVHSKAGVTYETQALKDLEALRSDIQKIPPKRTEDVYVIQHQSNPSTRSPVPHSAPPNASSYPTSPPAHGRRSSVETGRPSSAGLPSSPGRSFSGVSSPPPGSTVHAQSMFVPPSHKPPSQGQAGRINDLARSVVLVPGHEGASSSAGGNAGSRRIRDDRHRVDAKTAASKLSTMFNN